MISEKKYHKAHVYSPWCMHTYAKSLTQRGIQKILSALKLILCGVVVFIDMNTHTEVGMSFKTFLKENYLIALDSCYLFTKKC